jgi:hypothetical protein
MKPESFRDIPNCEHCQFCSWVTRKDAWCTLHEFDLNPDYVNSIFKICDDYQGDDYQCPKESILKTLDDIDAIIKEGEGK